MYRKQRTYDPSKRMLYYNRGFLFTFVHLTKPDFLFNHFHCRCHLRRRSNGEDGFVLVPPPPHRFGDGDESLTVSVGERLHRRVWWWPGDSRVEQ